MRRRKTMRFFICFFLLWVSDSLFTKFGITDYSKKGTGPVIAFFLVVGLMLALSQDIEELWGKKARGKKDSTTP
jgi:hypothetical protein